MTKEQVKKTLDKGKREEIKTALLNYWKDRLHPQKDIFSEANEVFEEPMPF